jgi:4'-phosphopantetheinyl transferase
MIYLRDDIQDFDFEASLPLLSDQRREQALKFRHEQGRKTCAMAYLMLCEGLQQEYGITEKPLFTYSEHGKPYLDGYPDIHFNLSHCREAVVCAISSRPVGIDVESIREYKDSLARYTMNEGEMDTITHAVNPALAFTRLWTMKEALLKLNGTGIVTDMRAVLSGHDDFTTVENVGKGYVFSVLYGK